MATSATIVIARAARPLKSVAVNGPAAVERRDRSMHYVGCRQVRAAGAAPIHPGEHGYRPGLDGDVIACEPYHGA